MSSSPPKETDGKPPAKKDPPPAAAAANKESGDKDAPAAAAAAAAVESEKPKEPEKVKLLASKTLLLRRALECPNGGTAKDRPTPGVPIAAPASKTKGGPTPNPVTTTATFPVRSMPPLEMPMPNIPHTEMFSEQFGAFQQQQQQQFFSAQAYQRKLALEMHTAALKEAAAEKKKKESTSKRAAAAAKTKRGRPKKTAIAIADADGVVGSPGAKAAPSEPGTPGAKRELLWEGTPPEEIEGGWPEGWLKKTFRRMGGSSAGTQDSYWVSPIKNYNLRSMREVKDFIAALEENGGDEMAAKKASKPPPKKKQKVDGDSMEVEAEVVQGGGVMDAVAQAVQDI